MQKIQIKPRYYTVKQLQQLENCGRDRAYELAKELPHEKRGKAIYVFSEDYDEYYQNKRVEATGGKTNANVYQFRKFI